MAEKRNQQQSALTSAIRRLSPTAVDIPGERSRPISALTSALRGLSPTKEQLELPELLRRNLEQTGLDTYRQEVPDTPEPTGQTAPSALLYPPPALRGRPAQLPTHPDLDPGQSPNIQQATSSAIVVSSSHSHSSSASPSAGKKHHRLSPERQRTSSPKATAPSSPTPSQQRRTARSDRQPQQRDRTVTPRLDLPASGGNDGEGLFEYRLSLPSRTSSASASGEALENVQSWLQESNVAEGSRRRSPRRSRDNSPRVRTTQQSGTSSAANPVSRLRSDGCSPNISPSDYNARWHGSAGRRHAGTGLRPQTSLSRDPSLEKLSLSDDRSDVSR